MFIRHNKKVFYVYINKAKKTSMSYSKMLYHVFSILYLKIIFIVLHTSSFIQISSVNYIVQSLTNTNIYI